MSDLLRMDYINNLPQPFVVELLGGMEFELESICVETGLLRIDVCGKLQVMEISDINHFTDMSGVKHSTDSFYTEFNQQ